MKHNNGNIFLLNILAVVVVLVGILIFRWDKGRQTELSAAEAADTVRVTELAEASTLPSATETPRTTTTSIPESAEPDEQSGSYTDYALAENVLDETAPEEAEYEDYTEYVFRNEELLNEHYEKHGVEMGFTSAEDYQDAASDVVENPAAEHKTEAEDGDDVYYIESTNEFVVVSTDGYIRTYFCPDDGRGYFDRQ